MVDHIHLNAQLQTQITDQALRILQGAGHGGGKIGAAHPPLPRVELCKHGCRYPIGRQLRLDGTYPLARVDNGPTAGRNMALEPIAVEIDQSRQDDIAR